jgi:hypothetical protein
MGRQQWNDKREALLKYYVSNGFNATKAAKLAGYAIPNNAGPLVVNSGIFRDRLKQKLAEMGISDEEIEFRLTRMARSSVAEFYTLREDGKGIVVDWKALAGPDRDLVRRLKISPDGTVTIEGHDQLRALELLAKARGMLVERVINEQAEQAPLSNAVLEQAMEDLRAYEDESQRVIKDWRDRMAKAGGPQAPSEQG